MRSEPIPDNSGKNVLDVTSTTMEDIVFKAKNDVFILFYKPDCRHCTNMMPVWMSLGDALKNEDVDIVRMNLRENEIPPEFKDEMFVKDYPSMFFKVYCLSKEFLIQIFSPSHLTKKSI